MAEEEGGRGPSLSLGVVTWGHCLNSVGIILPWEVLAPSRLLVACSSAQIFVMNGSWNGVPAHVCVP